ncbi:MAG: hypothetical protein HOW73_40795 [Polyangiaceae bacterium]|nr:hypothetical protein [Polyangiaceae bacterium]
MKRLLLAIAAALAACGDGGASTSTSTSSAGGAPVEDGAGGSGAAPGAGGGANGENGGASGCVPIEIGGDVASLVQSIADKMDESAGAGSEAFVVPSSKEREAFAAAVVAALLGDDEAGCMLPPSYRWVRLTDPDAGSVEVVAEVDADGVPSPSLHWGTFASLSDLEEAPHRPVAVAAPHPLFDDLTEMQAATIFSRGRARFLAVAGAHRCSNAAEVDCDGKTEVCNDVDDTPMPFRISDAAHAVESPFYAVHARLSDELPDLSFLQVHGFGSTGCFQAVVSDSSGTWPGAGPAAALATELEARDIGVFHCGLDDTGAACPCGETNVEARYSAGSTDACHEVGDDYGRFVHLEQLHTLREPDSAEGQATLEAILAAFEPIGP